MNWVDIVVIILLVLVFLGGLKEGTVKNFFSLVGTLIAIPLAGLSYRLIAALLSFLPGTDWENFVGFFITFGIIVAILQIIFFMPRRIIQAVWKKGLLYRLGGGVLNLLGGCIGFVILTLLVQTYPIFGWLERWVSGSAVLASLVSVFGFVPAMLPELFRQGATAVFAGVWF